MNRNLSLGLLLVPVAGIQWNMEGVGEFYLCVRYTPEGLWEGVWLWGGGVCFQREGSRDRNFLNFLSLLVFFVEKVYMCVVACLVCGRENQFSFGTVNKNFKNVLKCLHWCLLCIIRLFSVHWSIFDCNSSLYLRHDVCVFDCTGSDSRAYKGSMTW